MATVVRTACSGEHGASARSRLSYRLRVATDRDQDVTGPVATPDQLPEAPAEGPSSARQVAQRASRGALTAVGVAGVMNALQLVSSLVLARALVPEQYGAFAVGATIVGFGRFLGDCGAGSAVIQRPGSDPDDRELGRAFAIQGLVGLVATVSLVLGAPFVTDAFDAPSETTWIVALLALTLVVEAPSVVPRVRLRRQQRYQRAQLLGLLPIFVIYTVQISGLVLGFGVWALVVAQVVGSFVMTGTFALLGGGLVWPVLRGSLDLARRGIAYQGTLIVQATFAVTSLSVIGTALTTDELGLWTWCTVLATPLVSLAQNLQAVTFPSLSRLHEQGGDEHADAIGTAARLQFLFIPLAVGVLCALTGPIISYLFDDRWLRAEHAAQAALVGTLPLLLASLLAAGVDSSGRPGVRLRAMAISSFVGVAAAVPLSHAYGVTGAAAALSVVPPVVDTLILQRTARAPIVRACTNAIVVGGAGFIIAWLLRGYATGAWSLILVAVSASVMTLLLLPVVDRGPLQRAWTSLRMRSA